MRRRSCCYCLLGPDAVIVGHKTELLVEKIERLLLSSFGIYNTCGYLPALCVESREVYRIDSSNSSAVVIVVCCVVVALDDC